MERLADFLTQLDRHDLLWRNDLQNAYGHVEATERLRNLLGFGFER